MSFQGLQGVLTPDPSATGMLRSEVDRPRRGSHETCQTLTVNELGDVVLPEHRPPESVVGSVGCLRQVDESFDGVLTQHGQQETAVWTGEILQH